MPAEIIERTLFAGANQGVRLEKSEVARTLSIGTNWQKIRVGILCGIYVPSDQSVVTTAAFGILNGANDGNLYNQGPNHWFGTRFVNENLFESSGDYGVDPDALQSGKLVGSTFTALSYSTKVTGTWTHLFTDVTSGSPKATGLWLEIDKTSPDWTLGFFRDSNRSQSEFDNDMQLQNGDTPGVKFHEGTVSIDEGTDGDLDSVSFFWLEPDTHWLEIYDIQVNKLVDKV